MEKVTDVFKKQNIFSLETDLIEKMDKVVDGLGIEWHKGGQAIRGILIDAVNKAYLQGKCDEALCFKQTCCNHNYVYSNEGGVCTRCGAKTLQCCSD
jgi:hypothetical protein